MKHSNPHNPPISSRHGIRGINAVLVLKLICSSILSAQAPPALTRDYLPPPFEEYIERRVAELSGHDWLDEAAVAKWPAKQAAMRGQLRHMLGLDPWPAKTPLNPVVTGRTEGEGYSVEKFYFEPLPGLYIGANLYLPDAIQKPLPTILYMSGHARMNEGDIRFGNKTGYQHHGSWFARNGYVCLIVDTLDNGEIPGTHHGTHRLERWWWSSRGYTPAGVETWIGMRALDYLESRKEVDPSRIGMTGRSGGGVYTWWVGALDDRVKVAVPVAGITTLRDHVVEGAIEGHCDCMFMVNTERWDFDRVAALMAPRPLLISNTDSDDIFPLEGVMDIFNRTRQLYRRLGQEDKIGIHIAEGPHKDTQPLNAGAFNWLNRFLKDGDRMDLIDEPARRRHEPRELKVFAEIPADETVTTVDEFFVPKATPPPESLAAEEWAKQRDAWMLALGDEVFRAWPAEISTAVPEREARVIDGLRLTTVTVESQAPISLPLWMLSRDGLEPEAVGAINLHVLDAPAWEQFKEWMERGFPERAEAADGASDIFPQRQALLESTDAHVFFCPRGVGPSGFDDLSKAKQTHLLRRLLLLGESLESGQVWDIRQAAAGLRGLPGLSQAPLTVHAGRAMAVNAVYASLYIPGISRLDLVEPTNSHRSGPSYLNVLRHLDVPQALAMAAERSPIRLRVDNSEPWRYPQAVAKALGLEERVEFAPAW